jgi:glycosyltransferase involved in cell wall biosynthesis
MIKGLAELKVINEVVCSDDPETNYLHNDNFQIFALGPGKTSWCYSPNLINWLKKNLNFYDTVIVHGLWQYQTYAIFKVWKSLVNTKPKLFVMPHGMMDPYFQTAKGRKLKALRNLFFWMIIEKNIVNHSNGILFTCETERLLARIPFHPYSPKWEGVVGLGVEAPPDYNNSMETIFKKKIGAAVKDYFLFIGRIHPKKGVDILIEAYISFKRQHKNVPNLVIAGPGLETEYGKQIHDRAVATEGIYFTGMLTGDAKWGAFYGCDAFILPSHQENFGIAVVEALACGKAVLISKEVNIWREIEKEKAGIIKEDSVHGAYEMFESWHMMHQAEKIKMQKHAKEAYGKLYSISVASTKIAKAIE